MDSYRFGRKMALKMALEFPPVPIGSAPVDRPQVRRGFDRQPRQDMTCDRWVMSQREAVPPVLSRSVASYPCWSAECQSFTASAWSRRDLSVPNCRDAKIDAKSRAVTSDFSPSELPRQADRLPTNPFRDAWRKRTGCQITVGDHYSGVGCHRCDIITG